MTEKPKRKYFREKIGMVFRVPLIENNQYAYGQVATKCDYIFFDHLDYENQWTPVEDIIEKPIAFYATVDTYVLKKGLWEILGIHPVKQENQTFPESFGYNTFKHTYYLDVTIKKDGKNVLVQKPCTVEETYKHEMLASWGDDHIEQRLRDHFARRPNYDLAQQRSKHLGLTFMPIKEFYAQYGYNFHWLDEEKSE
ncbi:MAG: hypothetical protein HEEMFOPI_01764 [Holosporales bacterium]